MKKKLSEVLKNHHSKILKQCWELRTDLIEADFRMKCTPAQVKKIDCILGKYNQVINEIEAIRIELEKEN